MDEEFVDDEYLNQSCDNDSFHKARDKVRMTELLHFETDSKVHSILAFLSVSGNAFPHKTTSEVQGRLQQNRQEPRFTAEQCR